MSKVRCLEISDHPPKFFLIPDFFPNSPSTKSNIIFHDLENFNNQSFIEFSEKINWN